MAGGARRSISDWALVLPALAVLLIWLTREVAEYFSSTVEPFVWDLELPWQRWLGLLPLGLYVDVAMLTLQVLLWMALSLIHDRR